MFSSIQKFKYLIVFVGGFALELVEFSLFVISFPFLYSLSTCQIDFGALKRLCLTSQYAGVTHRAYP